MENNKNNISKGSPVLLLSQNNVKGLNSSAVFPESTAIGTYKQYPNQFCASIKILHNKYLFNISGKSYVVIRTACSKGFQNSKLHKDEWRLASQLEINDQVFLVVYKNSYVETGSVSNTRLYKVISGVRYSLADLEKHCADMECSPVITVAAREEKIQTLLQTF